MRYALIGLLLVGCGGAAIEHSGYPDGESQPWTRAKSLSLDDRYEAKVDGTLSYPKRDRARWFAIDLPAEGRMTATVTIDARKPGADLGMEILDAGFNVVSKEVDDELQPKKERVADNVAGKRAYVHIYTLKRPDEADFTLRVRFAPKLAVKPVEEPMVADEIPTPPELAAVSSSCARCRPSTGGTKPKVVTPQPPPAPKGVAARVVEFKIRGGKVQITINKGQSEGVEAGWKGYLVSDKGARIDGSDFSVATVRQAESEAMVGVTPDVVQQNTGVRLLKPAE